MGGDEVKQEEQTEAAQMSEDLALYLSVLEDKGFWGTIDAALYDELDDRVIAAVLNSVPTEIVQVRATMQVKAVLEAIYTSMNKAYTEGAAVLH